MANYHKRRRKRFHILKKMITGLLMVLQGRLEHHHEKEKVEHFMKFLDGLYE
jgi:hypothetical protein